MAISDLPGLQLHTEHSVVQRNRLSQRFCDSTLRGNTYISIKYYVVLRRKIQWGIAAAKKFFCLACIVAVCVILFVLASSFVVLAQYATQQTANVTIPASGIDIIGQSSTIGNVSIVICGTCGATGSVSTAIYNGNPQPDASVPSDVALSHFVAVSSIFLQVTSKAQK